jgi:mannose-6-phosphate isomerase
MLPVLTFEPIFKERIWGGRNLETLYGKRLPPGLPIGESWEISDRPGDESVVAAGPWKGKTLHQILQERPEELLGPLPETPKRFPLLIKIIDAREKLSLQVHPPALQAAQLGGEPKTEMWYVVRAGPAAELYAGLKRGVTRAEFEKQLALGSVAACFHRIPVKPGDALFLPSGRVHAIGAETMIFEVQQNSDTTYRVFDWNRAGASGRPRRLHLAESLASIDFADFEPALLPSAASPGRPGTIRPLVKDRLFQVSLRRLNPGGALALRGGRMSILGVVDGALRVSAGGQSTVLSAGGFCLIPACCGEAEAQAADATKIFANMAGQSCCSALNLGGAAAPPCRRREEFSPAPALAADGVAFLQVQLG